MYKMWDSVKGRGVKEKVVCRKAVKER